MAVDDDDSDVKGMEATHTPTLHNGMPDKIKYTGEKVIDEAQKVAKAERDRFYRSKRWIDRSKLFLARNPLCAACTAQGNDVIATHVHHIVERLQLPQSEWYRMSGLSALCASCHAKVHASRRHQ